MRAWILALSLALLLWGGWTLSTSIADFALGRWLHFVTKIVAVVLMGAAWVTINTLAEYYDDG